MAHIPDLISDLGVILCSAGVMTILFKALKQPVVLGYIVAGVIAGSTIFHTPLVKDVASIRIWADIGVIFLLFALGIEFSFKKLLHIGGTAAVSAGTIIAGMMTAGYMIGYLMGWGTTASIFLGAMLSMSSTTIIYKAFDDLGLRNQNFAKVVFGVLIVEDLFAVLIMVFFTTFFSAKSQAETSELFLVLLKLGGFLLFWFVTGIFVLPSFFKCAKKLLNDETLLIIVIGMCLGMVILATKLGFSSALGAFVMGSILAETLEAEHIEHIMKPVKDLFAAVFFVSVGMMINLSTLSAYVWPIVIITVVVIIGQFVFATIGIILSGQPLRVAVKSGLSLGQIGEFAFIIAGLGYSLGAIDYFLYPVAVAVSVVTTFFTPYLIKLSDPVYFLIEKHLPVRWKIMLSQYTSGVNTNRQKGTWNKLLKALLRIVVVYSTIAIGIVWIMLGYVSPLIHAEFPGTVGSIITTCITILAISPFLRAIMMKKNHSVEFQKLWNDNKYNRGPLISLIILRIALCTLIVLYVLVKLFTIKMGLLFAISVPLVLLFIFSGRLKKHSINLEKQFMRNLHARQDAIESKTPFKQGFVKNLLARDLHIAEYDVSPNSPSVGKSLQELNLRRHTGVNVISIVRGAKHINIPGGEDKIYPCDKLVVVGTDKELELFDKFVQERHREEQVMLSQEEPVDVVLEQILVDNSSFLYGKSIRQSALRDKASSLVIGVERGVTSLKNPDPDLIFEIGDIVWIAGEREKIEALFAESE